jgi:hypothetical protein
MRGKTILKCVPLLATAIAAPAFAQSAAPDGLSDFLTSWDATAEAVLIPSCRNAALCSARINF